MHTQSDCFDELLSELQSAVEQPRSRVKKRCMRCQRVFATLFSATRFCSVQCAQEAQKQCER